MRFTDGLWESRNGYKLHRAHSLWEWRAEKNQVHFMVPCTEIRSLRDTIAGPVLHFTITAPKADILAVKVYHFTGKKECGPYFDLDVSYRDMEVCEMEQEITVTNGRMKAVVRKTGDFGIAFYFDGRFLTKCGEKGTAYVTDAEYEADKLCDYNGRNGRSSQNENYIREMLSLDVGEYIYGLGERFTSCTRNGQSVDCWNRDGGSNGNQAYKNIPFYLSSKSYGVFVNTPARVGFEVANVSVRHVEIAVQEEELEYMVIGGSEPKEVLSNYTALTGRTPVPPAWTYGLWLSTSWMPDSDAQITLDTIDKMKEYDIPLSVFHFDARWMDDFKCCDFVWSKRFGDAKKLLDAIHERGVKVCVWINPYISQESYLFREGKDKGYFLKTKDGDVWQSDNWMSGIAIVDFTNPEAVRWYQSKLGALLDMGVDALKTDFGERIPTNVVYFDGSDSAKMHNYYPYLYNQAVYELIQEKKGEGCVFSRSATAGTQKFPFNWGGDNEASYISMAESLRGGLSLCQSGYGYWAHDISGFCRTATPDLYKRWVQFGMLSTHSRLHGEQSYRAPWYFDEESCRVLKAFTNLKCRLMPYLYSGSVQVLEEGVPLMRAMMLEFPQCPTSLHLERQYMLGSDLLAAPIFNEEGQAEFFLPGNGCWTNYLDGEILEGGKWYRRNYDYFHMPLFVRPGTILPVGAEEDTPVYDYADGVTFQLYEIPEAFEKDCRVYNTSGEPVLKLNVKRMGENITLELQGQAEHVFVQLMHVNDIRCDGEVRREKCENGIRFEMREGILEFALQS